LMAMKDYFAPSLQAEVGRSDPWVYYVAG